MRRLVAEAAEVIDRADETSSEDVVPESVAHHAGGQRIIGGGDLRREFQTSAAGGHEGLGVEGFQVATGDDGGWLLIFAAHEEWHVEPFGLEEAGSAARFGEFCFQSAVFADECGELGRRGRRSVEHPVADPGVEQRGLGLGGFITSPGGGGYGEGVGDSFHGGERRCLRDHGFAGRAGFAGGMEDDLADAVEAFPCFGFLIRIGRVLRQGQFEISVGALTVSGVEGDPGRLFRVDARLGEAGAARGERIVVRDESQRRALTHGLDADEVRRDLEAGRGQDGAVLSRERVRVQAGREHVLEHVTAVGLDTEISRGEAAIEAVTMTTPSRGALVVQGPVGLFAPRSRGLLGLQSDPQEGGRMQRISGISLVVETLGEFAVGSIDLG